MDAPSPALLLHASGRITHANASAEALLRLKDGLTVTDRGTLCLAAASAAGQTTATSMKHQPLQSITSLPPSPEEERRARMIKYSVMMGIRVACIVALLFVQGWWILVFAAGAVFLPYFAVVVANGYTIPEPSEEAPVDCPA